MAVESSYTYRFPTFNSQLKLENIKQLLKKNIFLNSNWEKASCVAVALKKQLVAYVRTICSYYHLFKILRKLNC